MTCKDCIHYEVCIDYTTLKESDFAQNFNETEKLCDHFKNKADFVEVRHGEWVEGDYGETIKLACSSCGAPFEYRTTFCPDCGAKMEEL